MVRKGQSQRKEKASEKKERRAANALARQQFFKIGLPILVGVLLLIVVFVYLVTKKH